MVGVALSCLDTALVNVALPRIAKDLNSSPAASIWVINAYQLAVMISLLPLASFGDIFGYDRVYRFGLMLYTGAALISTLAGSLEMLTLGRALQGLGAAGIMSVNTALIRYTYPRRQLGRGIALTSLVVSTSSAAGPTLAAGILSVVTWSWLFAVNVPIGIATLALSMRLLPRTEPSGHRFDLWSAALCALMFGSLVSGINGLGHRQTALAVAGRRGRSRGDPADRRGGFRRSPASGSRRGRCGRSRASSPPAARGPMPTGNHRHRNGRKHPFWQGNASRRLRPATKPQTSKTITAPTVAPMSPAPSSARYQPTACPRYVATKAPTIPSSVVRTNPDGSLSPGVMNLAITPAINPMMILQMMCMGRPCSGLKPKRLGFLAVLGAVSRVERGRSMFWLQAPRHHPVAGHLLGPDQSAGPGRPGWLRSR
jgi:hypothetical protein